MSKYGYSDKKAAVLKRLSRAEGQVRGVARMVGEDKYCIDILTQIAAAQAALDKVALELLTEHARHCMMGGAAGQENVDAKVQEMVAAVGRLLAK